MRNMGNIMRILLIVDHVGEKNIHKTQAYIEFLWDGI